MSPVQILVTWKLICEKTAGTAFPPHSTAIPFKNQRFLELKEILNVSKFLLSFCSTYYTPQNDFVLSFLFHCLMAAI